MRALTLLYIWATISIAESNRPWMRGGSGEERAKELLQHMTLEEKMPYLHGWGTGGAAYSGHVPANDRLGIPALKYNDGPQGFRWDPKPGTSTCFPSALTMAASWDEDAMHRWAKSIATEFYGKGTNVQLGPGVNIARVPLNGRNFEYLSGEDPFLGYTLVQPVIKGIQSSGVVACVKHFVGNNQEHNRYRTNADVDERTMFEIYYPPFEGAIKAGVGSAMCSFNKINGVFACMNNATLNTDLRERLGFKGYVMSDWSATHSFALAEGLDQEMPFNLFYNNTTLKHADQALVDQSVVRILTQLFNVGAFDKVNPYTIERNVTSVKQHTIAQELAEASAVLLRNERNTLPLNRDSPHEMLVVGDAAWNAVVHGGGSGRVDPAWVKPPVWSLCDHLGVPRVELSPDGDGSRQCNKDASQCVTYINSTEDLPLGVTPSVIIIFVGVTSHEGEDRKDLSFGSGQDELMDYWATRYPYARVVVSMANPGAVLTPWASKVDAILTTFLAGQAMGDAVANLLFGKTNPSGKLPITFPNVENEMQFTEQQYPGLGNASYVTYTEKLLVGYRWYDRHQIVPAFPFGHGLSYTTFDYWDLETKGTPSGWSIRFSIKNMGPVWGQEVAQLYVAFPSDYDEPPKQLKGLQKVGVAPGTSQSVSFELTPRTFSIWDVKSHAWVKQEGGFWCYIGSSSTDIRLLTKLTVS